MKGRCGCVSDRSDSFATIDREHHAYHLHVNLNIAHANSVLVCLILLHSVEYVVDNPRNDTFQALDLGRNSTRVVCSIYQSSE